MTRDRLILMMNTGSSTIIDREGCIVILGNEEDATTYMVLRYVLQKGRTIVKINDSDEVKISRLELTSEQCRFQLVFSGMTIDSDDIAAYYYRRSDLLLGHDSVKSDYVNLKAQDINTALWSEAGRYKSFLHSILENCPTKIGARANSAWDKLFQLREAIHAGLKVPDTYIVQKRDELVNLLAKYKKIATKGIGNGIMVKNGDHSGVGMFTNIIEQSDVTAMAPEFAPTLFQEYIDKKYELRIFFLHGVFYPVAIFSQAHAETRIDFRRYSNANPSRIVPYSLPQPIENMLRQMMASLKMDTGSIDMIVNTNGEYLFLEVNPDGQFAMVSQRGNYHIERKIAEILTS